MASLTLQLPDASQLRIIAGHFPSGKKVSAETLALPGHGLTDGIPTVLCPDANSHHPPWGPSRPAGKNPSKAHATTFAVDPTTNRSYCPYCGSKRHARWALRHVRAHHPGKPEPLLPPPMFVGSRRCRSPPRKESESDDADTALDAGRKKCPFCDKSCAYTWLSGRIRGAHPNEQLPETEPRSAPPKRRRLQPGQRIWPCDECELQFFSKDALRSHKKAKHNDAPKAPQTDASTHRFRCDACDETCASRAGLTYHVQRQHPMHGVGVEIDDGQKEETIAIVTKTLKCPHCPVSLATEDKLRAHLCKIHDLREMKKNHPSWLKPHVCEETPAHLLLCPGLEAIRTKHVIPSLEKPAVFFSREVAKMLCELFRLDDPCPTPPEHESETPSLEGDRSPSLLVSTSPSRPRRLGAEKVKGRLLRKRRRSLEGHGTNGI